jgi:hypothetical protein
MAGHWIKWEKGLTRKPEVMAIAAALGSTDAHAAACCMMVWEWADDVTVDGLIRARPEAVDKIAGQPGLAAAMEDAGWLVVSGLAIQFPNYARHNGKNGKRRALEASRQGQHRNHKGTHSVTHEA